MNQIKALIRDMPTLFVAYLVIAVPFLLYALGTMLAKIPVTNIVTGVVSITVGIVAAKLLKKWANQY